MTSGQLTALVAMAVISCPAAAFAQSAADAELAAADAAVEAENWDEALAALERAYVAEPDPYFLYRRILVLEKMGESSLALEVLRENRNGLLESDRVNDLVVVEERLQSAISVDASVETMPEPSPNPWPIVSVVAGGAVAATGGLLLYLGGRDLAKLRCAEVAAGGEVCGEPSDIGPISQGEFEDRVAQASTLRTTGAILLPLGLVAGGVGYLLTSRRGGGAAALHFTGSGFAFSVSFH